MKPSPNQLEAETLLEQMGDQSTLQLLNEIRILRCENQRLHEQISKLHKTNGGTPP